MKSILLIGLNHFGFLLAEQLRSLGHQIMAVDKNEDKVNKILPLVTDAQIGDSTDAAFLKALGINNYDICFVNIEKDFQSSLETTSLLRELGGKLIVSRAGRDVQAKFLLKNGADDVIDPEKQVAEWAAIRYASDHILDYIRLDDGHAVIEITVPREWIGKTVGHIDIRKRYGINIIAVKENGKMNLSVSPETVLAEGMTLLVLGEQKAVQKCFRI